MTIIEILQKKIKKREKEVKLIPDRYIGVYALLAEAGQINAFREVLKELIPEAIKEFENNKKDK